MTDMRLLLPTRILPHHGQGGMQGVAWNLARELARQGVSVTILTTQIFEMPSHFIEDGVEIISLPYTKPGRYSKEWWRESRSVFKRELASRITGVLSVSSAAYSMLLLKDRLLGVPFVMQAHGTSIGEMVSKWRLHKIKSYLTSLYNINTLFKDLATYNKFDAIVAVGDKVYKDLTHFPISIFLPQDRIHLILNGIDTRVFCPNPAARLRVRNEHDITQDDRVIITVSRLHSQKGIDLSLRGFARYVKQNSKAYYWIIGEGPDENQLKQLARKLGIEARVHFFGSMDNEKVAHYINAADVFLFTTTRTEGLPINVLEALATGIPVIVSNHLVFDPEINKKMTFVNPRNNEAISQAIDTVLKKVSLSYVRRSSLPDAYRLYNVAKEYIILFEHLQAKLLKRNIKLV